MNPEMVQGRIFIHQALGGHEVVCRISNGLSQENYLTQVTFQQNGNVQTEFRLGRHVSPHPMIGTLYSSLETGHTITVSWRDMAGRSGSFSREFDGQTD